MKTSRVVLTIFAVAFACFVAPIAAINAQSGDKTTTVTLTIEGMT